MAGRILIDDGGRAFDTNGVIISGAKLKAFLAGTSTASTLYTTRGLTVAHASPVVASAAGFFAQIWADEGVLLDIKLYAAADVTYVTPLRSFLNVTPQGGPGTSRSVKSFGVLGDGTTNDTTNMATAVAYAIANDIALIIPAGTYLLTADGVNFAGAGLHIYGEGNPILLFTGTGKGFVMDSGTNGVTVGGMHAEGFIIKGAAAAMTDGFYSRGIVRSVFRDIEVREVNAKAFHIKHGVSNQYDSLKFSTNDVAQTTTPAVGLYIDNNGAGYYTADCTFINPAMEAFVGIAASLVDASGNVFVGGTFETTTTGLSIAAASDHNSFTGLWCEGNTAEDAQISGNLNDFTDCHFQSASSNATVRIIASGVGTVFRGGYIRTIDLHASSTRTRLRGTSINASAAGITGSGTYTVSGTEKVDGNFISTGQVNDSIGPVEAIKFAATQVSSSDANTLDDYEEGTWSPVLVPAGGTITPNAAATGGDYTKVGNVVTLNCMITVTSVAAPTGDLSITGVPFAAKTGATKYRTGSFYGSVLEAASTGPIQVYLAPAAVTLYIFERTAGSNVSAAPRIKASSEIFVSITYQTA